MNRETYWKIRSAIAHALAATEALREVLNTTDWPPALQNVRADCERLRDALRPLLYLQES